VLAELLHDAREGKLVTRWREELRVYALGLPRLGASTPRSEQPTATGNIARKALASDECLMVSAGHATAALADIDDETERLHQLYTCAVLDVARRKRASWEPYAAQGDWRRGLGRWYADRIATFEQSGYMGIRAARVPAGLRAAVRGERRGRPDDCDRRTVSMGITGPVPG